MRQAARSGWPKLELDDIPAGATIEFEYQLPVDDETCRAQISRNLRRDVLQAISRRKLTVIAGGPSARHVDLSKIEGETLALNGALALFLEQGLKPTFWACCDPQEKVVDFLPEIPPYGIVYLVASKCHPAVFDRLNWLDVYIWNLVDHPAEGQARIALASSVTISASWLMHRMGFTDFEYWGWDGCFMDGRHHASSDADWSSIKTIDLNYGGKIVDGECVGGDTFKTTVTWAAEARGAEQFFHLAEYFDISVKINGGGMFARAQKSVQEMVKE